MFKPTRHLRSGRAGREPMLELPFCTVEVPRVARCIDDVGSMKCPQKWSMLLQPTDESRNRAQTIVDKYQGDQRSGLTGLLLHGNWKPMREIAGRSIVSISSLRQRLQRNLNFFPKECHLLLPCFKEL